MPVDTLPPEPQTAERQLIGQYDLLAKIAEGGMGAVYKGRSRVTGELVAVKVVPPHLLKNHVFLKRFEQEYNVAKTLNHDNIVRGIDYGHDCGVPYMVMEFIEGESLGQRLERERRLSERDAINIISQVAQGLHKAHKLGIIHRDVKPDNILMTRDGQAKLTDLGLVKELETDLNLTRTGRGLGTPHFMAPEQFRNAKKADVRCDIYSLAATMYQMVTGELPFKSLSPLDAWMKKLHNELAPPLEVMPGLSDRMDWAIRRSMSCDPTQRAGSCREFVEDLTGQSARKIVAAHQVGIAQADLWYMVYKDEEDVLHTVKGSTEGIRRSLKQGLLGDAGNIRACRSKQGPFELLHNLPEFRDLAIELTESALSAACRNTPPPRTTPVPRPAAVLVQHASPLRPPSGGVSSPVLPALPPAPPPPAYSPHIVLERTAAGTPEFAKWLVLIFFAGAAGVGGYFLLPMLAYLRLFW